MAEFAARMARGTSSQDVPLVVDAAAVARARATSASAGGTP
jgi:hypothetical protein